MQKGFAPFFSDIPVQLGMLSARLLPCIFILLKIVYSPAEHSDLLAPVSLSSCRSETPPAAPGRLQHLHISATATHSPTS